MWTVKFEKMKCTVYHFILYFFFTCTAHFIQTGNALSIFNVKAMDQSDHVTKFYIYSFM